MKEIRSILKTYAQKEPNEKVALATVVRVEGSSYRRMGARMLVSENGTWVGGISGGCLEGDALKRARMAILKDRASIITYDTSTGDDHQIGVGLGCNGIIDVLFTPIDENDPNNAIAVLNSTNQTPRKVRKLVSITFSDDKKLLGKLLAFTGIEILKFLESYADIEKLYKQIELLEKSKNLVLSEQITLFIEVVPPALQILLFGHQYDLYPLIRQIRELGWDYSVIAPPAKVKDENVVAPEDIDRLNFDDFTAVILMSHSLATDKDNLTKLSDKSLRYIGMLGPKVRSERILNELAEEGKPVHKELLNHIYAPTGLDIGATNPEEIALSILAEIKTVFSERTGLHLRERQSPIHVRDEPMNFD
ncbi:XdhC family protein [uncultured Arcticibacterium sp.]|uniref:XdhC family protein n=1 Tax=uncultured Arcticibacterium sp. TaxID=2173042 RepID=UPI0030F6BA34